MSEKGHIGILSLELHLPASQSLKHKRRILKSLKDRVRPNFNASISEIADLDKWQKAVFGICMIGNDKNHLDQSLQAILALLERIHEIRIVRHQIEFI